MEFREIGRDVSEMAVKMLSVASDLFKVASETEEMSEYSEEKQNLLKHYAESEPKRFFQYDVFGESDSDLWQSITTELMSGSSVRVLIPTDATQEQTIKCLERITESVTERWPSFDETQEIPF